MPRTDNNRRVRVQTAIAFDLLSARRWELFEGFRAGFKDVPHITAQEFESLWPKAEAQLFELLLSTTAKELRDAVANNQIALGRGCLN